MKKATKKKIVWPEGAKNPDRFEYRTASEQYLVAEICAKHFGISSFGDVNI